MEPIPDFSDRRSFPGTLDNDFDIILRRVEDVEKIPSLLFAGLLFLVAVPPTFGHWGWAVGLWVFFLIDWALLSLLPRFGYSFGPAKPSTLILAVMRMVFAFLPFPIAVGLQGLGTLLVIYGFWIEPHYLKVTRTSASRMGIPSADEVGDRGDHGFGRFLHQPVTRALRPPGRGRRSPPAWPAR